MFTTLFLLFATAWSQEVPSICDDMRSKSPNVERVEQGLADGADPNQVCHWTVQVPMISTLGGILFAVLVPPIGIPIGIMETVPKRRSSGLLKLAVNRRSLPLVDLLLTSGAHPYDSAVSDSVRADQYAITFRLIDGGATPSLLALGDPLIGDPARLAQLTEKGVTLSTVTQIDENRTLRTDPAVARAFLAAGLPAERLLPEAADSGGIEVVRLLLPQVDTHAGPAYQALREAVADRRWELVEVLHEGGVPLEPSTRADPVLCTVVKDGSRASVERLLEIGADPDATDVFGNSALNLSSKAGRLDLMALLLDAGADPLGALPGAIEHGNEATIDLLINAGAVLNSPEVLRASLSAPSDSGVKRLLEAGVSPTARVSGKRSWAVAAVREERLDLVALLVDAGAPVDGTSSADSLLKAAIDKRDAPLIRAVMALGADPKALPDVDAAWSQVDRSEDLLMLLLNELHLKPSPEFLRRACQSGDLERVQLLLAHGADPTAKAKYGRYPMESAQTTEIQDALLTAGARPTRHMIDNLMRADNRDRIEAIIGSDGAGLFGPDHVADAVRKRDADTLQWLLDHGADPDAKRLGAAPLWHAVDNGCAPCASALLAAGAEADLVRYSEGILTLAIEEGRLALVGPLVEAGARFDPEGIRTKPMQAAVFKGVGSVDALLAAGHPRTQAVLEMDARNCALDRLEAGRNTWPDDRSELRRAARRGGCGREVRRMLR